MPPADEIADCGANLQSLNASCADDSAMLQTATQDIDALNAAAAENAARLLELQAAVDAAEQDCVDTTAELQGALAAEHLVASTAIREACNETLTSGLAAAQVAAQDHCLATTLSLQSTLTAEHEVVTAALQATCDESVISSLAAAQEECLATTTSLQVALAAEHAVSTELLQANCNSTLAQSMAAAQQTCLDTTAALQSALSAEHAAAAAALQAALDRQLAEVQAACTESLQSQENASAQEIAAINAAREQDAARFQQQMRMLHCPTPVVPHADVAGDTAFGGSGMTIVCNDGFADDGVTNMTVSCSTSGEWSPAVPNCVSINPCTNSEDDCDPLADCAHTGPGTHSCECVSGVSFGTGDVCSECTQSCGIGQVATAACTTTSDTVCEAVVGEALPSIIGATVTYTNGFAYPTTATYRCDLNSNTMNRTLQPDGSWTAATDLICCGEGEEPGSTGCENCPSGTFSSDGSSCVDCAAGEFSGPAQSACVPPPSGDWLVAAEGVSCPAACNATNATCNAGDWGVADEASFRAAVGAAGEGADALCPNGIFGKPHA